MFDVPLRAGEIASILQAIEVSTMFYRKCKELAIYKDVVGIFDDMLLTQENLRLKLENYLSQTPKE